MNGDDGYSDHGGGGSTWWRLRVSEATGIVHESAVVASQGNHRTRKDGHSSFLFSGSDKFTELDPARPDHMIGGARVSATHPEFVGQGKGYFVVTIDNATQIERIEIQGETLRVYLPIVTPPGHQRVRQVSLKWGLRVFGAGDGAPGMWAAVKAKLLGSAGVAEVTRGGSVERGSGGLAGQA